MSLTRVTDLVDEILASQLNQYAELLEGDALKGKPVALTALNDLTNWSLKVANQDTTNGRALLVQKANLIDPWIQADVNGVLIDGMQGVIQSVSPGAPGSGRAAIYPFADGWRSKVASGTEFRILGAAGAPTDGYTLLGSSSGINIWEPVARKNRLANGAFPVWQRGSSGPTVTDNAYGPDRWRLLIEAASAAVLAQETVATPGGGSHYACKLSIGATNNDKIGIFQPIKGSDMWDLRGSVASLQFQMEVSNARIGDVRAAIVQWTGTEDAISADPINVWGAAGTVPTYTGSWANANTPANLSPTTSYAQYKIENVSISASATNLAVFIWIEDKTTTAADYLLVTDIQLEKGAVCTAVERMADPMEILRCQHYYWQALGSTGGEWPRFAIYGAASQSALSPISNPVDMRVAPSITKIGSWTTANCGQPSFSSITPRGFDIAVTVTALGAFDCYPASSSAGVTVNAEL